MTKSDRSDFEGLKLQSLPGTELEAQYLKRRALNWGLQDKLFLSEAATEAELKLSQSPYILHLATHGFFLTEDPKGKPTSDKALLDNKPGGPLHSPMQRSGLALAGARTTLDAWKRGEVPSTENDGILTAQEVGMLI